MLSLWKPNALRRKNNGLSVRTEETPAAPAVSLFDEFDRLFERTLHDFAYPSVGWSQGANAYMAADIAESDEDYRVSMDLPGLSAKDIDVKLEGETLTIRAERIAQSRESNESFLRCERSYGVLQRSFTLPGTIDAAKVAAKYEDGVLHLTLPKKEESKPRAITVQVK